VFEPRRYIYVTRYLRERGIPYTVPDSLDELRSTDIVYTDNYSVHRDIADRVYKVVYNRECSRKSIEKAILALRDREEYNLVSIGVDPGSEYTVVIICDGEVVEWRHIGSKEEAIEYIVEAIEGFPSRNYEVKIGMGGDGVLLAGLVKERLGSRATVEVVDESESSPRGPWRNPFIEKMLVKRDRRVAKKRDVYAAITIALKKGVLVDTSVKNRDSI